MGFSMDGKLLVTLCGEPGWQITYWNWDQNKVLATVKLLEPPAIRMTINPYESYSVFALCANSLKVYRYRDGNLNLHNTITPPQPAGSESATATEEFFGYQWLKGGQLVVCGRRGLWIVEDGKFASCLDYPEEPVDQSTAAITASTSIAAITNPRPPLTCIAAYKDGFFVGGEGKTIYHYTVQTEHHQSQPSGRQTKFIKDSFEIRLPDDAAPVRTLQLNMSEAILICQTQTHQVYVYNLDIDLNINRFEFRDHEIFASHSQQQQKRIQELQSKLNALRETSASQTALNNNSKQEQQQQQQLSPPKTEPSRHESWFPQFHHGPINGVSNCIRKPVLITSSLDKSVRMWNYLTGECLMTKYFGEEAFGVSLHPACLYAIVGFSDKLRLFDVHDNDLRLHKEFNIRACRDCVFSRGGQWFAAVNGNSINVYNSYTGEQLYVLKGHHGKVRGLSWSFDDKYLISCGTDGAVYCWATDTMRRDQENILKGCSYYSAVMTPDGTVNAVGSDKTIRVSE